MIEEAERTGLVEPEERSMISRWPHGVSNGDVDEIVGALPVARRSSP